VQRRFIILNYQFKYSEGNKVIYVTATRERNSLKSNLLLNQRTNINLMYHPRVQHELYVFKHSAHTAQ